MTTSRPSALSINVLLIFDMQGVNSTSFLNAISFCSLLFSFAAAAKRSIGPFVTIYAS